MMGKLKEPKFKNLDEEMAFYANIDRHAPMQEATPAEIEAVRKSLGLRPRKAPSKAKKKSA